MQWLLQMWTGSSTLTHDVLEFCGDGGDGRDVYVSKAYMCILQRY